jgi:hypothetical protein
MRRLLAPALIGALVAAVPGCVAPPPPRQQPAPPRTTPPPAPRPAPLAADWRDWPLTPGTWAYNRDARGSRALFGQGGVDAALVLRCDRAERRIFLSRAGSGSGPLTIRTTSATRALAVQPTGGTPPYVAVALAPSDPLLDAAAFSRGKLTVEQAGAPTLVVPAWAEIGRVVEDCRG